MFVDRTCRTDQPTIGPAAIDPAAIDPAACEIFNTLAHDHSPTTLARALHLLDLLEARVTTAVGEFDHHQLYELDQATSTTTWLTHHGGLTPRQASTLVTSARRLRALPATTHAYSTGTLSGGQIAAITTNLADHTLALFATHETELVPILATLTTRDTTIAMRQWAARADALTPRRQPAEPDQRLALATTLDGTWHLTATLDPLAGTIVTAALRVAIADDQTSDPTQPVRTLNQRQADALVDICRYYLDHQHHRPPRRHRPHLNIVIDLDDLTSGPGTTLDGTALDPAAIQALCCDANIHRVITSGQSTILDYGRATPTIPTNLWNAVALRDQHCRYPGCHRPPHWCQAHHITPWAQGGPTRLDNLTLLCSRHHHHIHQHHTTLTLTPSGTIHFTHPNGTTQSTHPPNHFQHQLQLQPTGPPGPPG